MSSFSNIFSICDNQSIVLDVELKLSPTSLEKTSSSVETMLLPVATRTPHSESAPKSIKQTVQSQLTTDQPVILSPSSTPSVGKRGATPRRHQVHKTPPIYSPPSAQDIHSLMSSPFVEIRLEKNAELKWIFSVS